MNLGLRCCQLFHFAIYTAVFFSYYSFDNWITYHHVLLLLLRRCSQETPGVYWFHPLTRDSRQNRVAKRVEIYDTCAMIDSSEDSVMSGSKNREEKSGPVMFSITYNEWAVKINKIEIFCLLWNEQNFEWFWIVLIFPSNYIKLWP